MDDIPSPPNCKHVVFVLSTVPKASIKGVDTSKALAVPGVKLWIDDADSSKQPICTSIPAL